jgi:hypothetical protein
LPPTLLAADWHTISIGPSREELKDRWHISVQRTIIGCGESFRPAGHGSAKPTLPSQYVEERAQSGNCLGKPLAFQGGQKFLCRLGRVSQALPLPLDGSADGAGRHFHKAHQEVVRMLSLDVEAGQGLGRKVGEIAGRDDVGAGPDRRGEDVAVIRIG